VRRLSRALDIQVRANRAGMIVTPIVLLINDATNEAAVSNPNCWCIFSMAERSSSRACRVAPDAGRFPAFAVT